MSSPTLCYSISMKQILEDDDRDPISLLVKLRLPWLFVGLCGGILATLLSSRFESILESDIRLAFFIPFIVYMADALGAQTENVYVRNLADGKVNLGKYLVKETVLGISVGALFGLIIGTIAFIWLDSIQLALTVSISLLATMSVAPIVSLIIPSILQKERRDPAVGAAPITTVIQDILSLFIYFAVATFILLG